MQFLQDLFSTTTIVFSIAGYGVSYIELLGTILSLCAYIEIIRRKSRGLVISMLGCFTLVFLFHQIQLYSDMMLMIYYIIASAIALVFWQKSKKQNHADQVGVTRLNGRTRIALLVLMLISILLFSFASGSLHAFFPILFPDIANFIVCDAITTTLGIAASILLVRRNMESMFLWLAADIISFTIYSLSGVVFLAGVYLLYGIVDFTGCILWTRASRN